MSTAYFYDKQYEQMYAIDKAVLEIEPNNVNAIRGIGVYYAVAKKDDIQAIEYYDKTIQIKPDYHYAWYNKSRSLTRREMYEKAIIAFEKAHEINPDAQDVIDNLESAKKILAESKK